MLEVDVKKACVAIRSSKSGSRLHLLFNCSSMLELLQHSTNEIARVVRLLNLTNLNVVLDLKSKAEEIIRGMDSSEFRVTTAVEVVVFELDKSITKNGGNRACMMKLPRQIVEAVSASPDAALMRREITLLKEDKEEQKEQKQHAQAL